MNSSHQDFPHQSPERGSQLSSPRRLVIGDVHGHYGGLLALLDLLQLQASDQVYFLGDLIDRGPASAQVVELVMSRGYTCLLGNHEQMCLNALYGRPLSNSWQAWLMSGGNDTLDSYGSNGIPRDHLDWLRNLPLYLDLDDVWLVHAGLDPTREIEEQSIQEFCWIREAFHSCTAPYFHDKLIITGHTITFTLPGVQPGQIAQGQGWLDIDTGAYHPRSGWMTALDLSTGIVYQVNVFLEQRRKLPLSELVATVEPSRIGRPFHRSAFRG
ncbi:metallophosphoesterase family protein [Leptolyngbya sp. FACHB-261]|uniref:metallophosphoesterase family protein n=1 Tax=Leptolyngbya sp. FACHB-261 TaxID=2692806 RepID=UPI0016828E82|nr:metallophosphoesterase family protein [Leptolyngbya sp. FACHB-261]MBD2101994.1 serine/threonine protein phosphatase [Leptolyngbya sp. FACHB-261]